jgi:hypothetical protein
VLLDAVQGALENQTELSIPEEATYAWMGTVKFRGTVREARMEMARKQLAERLDALLVQRQVSVALP